MTCEQVERRISDYLLQPIPVAQRSELQEHFDGCDSCRKLLELTAETMLKLGGIL